MPDHRPLAWITGARGLVGHHLLQAAPARWRPRGLSREDCDLQDHRALAALFNREKPALVIHCAGLTKSPACQANPALARQLNVEATRLLTELAAEIPFLFFSTDLIFDGKTGDYAEEDAPNPLSIYGETKAEAEQLVRAHPRHAIVRLSLTGGQSPTRDRGFNEEMENAWREGKALHLFTDEFRCPMAAPVTAKAIWEFIEKEAAGTYHLCGSEKLSRADIGRLLAERHPELNPRIIPGSRRDYQGPPRPADTSMNCSKIQGLLSFPMPGFSDWLAKHPGEPF